VNGLAVILADAWRIALLTAAAPIIGSVLLLAIARLTGARWTGIDRLGSLAAWLVAGGALLGLGQIGVDAPVHLKPWMSWWGVGLRMGLAGLVMAYAAGRLRAAASTTFAGVTLALYTALATPLASDWMLGQVPGHPVSAIGMMLTVEAIAAAAAVMLVAGWGTLPTRQDLSRLMVAALLGLGYLTFMDFLIIWFGNLPSRVGFYLDRSTPVMVALVWAAVLSGLVAPVGLLSLVRGERGRRAAGGAALVGLLLFNCWWVAGGVVAVLLGAVLSVLLAGGATVLLRRREVAHG